MVAQYATRPDIVTHHATKKLPMGHLACAQSGRHISIEFSTANEHAHVLHNIPSVWQQHQNKHSIFGRKTGDCRCVPHLGGLARACFTNHHDHLVLSDDLQQLITAVIHRQKAPLLLQGPALGPVTDSLQNQMLS